VEFVEAKLSNPSLPRKLNALSAEWHYWNDEHTVIWRNFGTHKGKLILVGDSYAFCKKRLQSGNKETLERMLELVEHKVKAVRIVQRDRYRHPIGRFIWCPPEWEANKNKIPFPREYDPAFAPAMSDSNDKKTYEMTQQEFFSMEKYSEPPSKENSDFDNMMRVRVYDDFISPNKDNDKAWHFAIKDAEEKKLEITPDFKGPGYKIMRVKTLFHPDVAREKALLASISPESKMLNICVYSVGLKDPREQELEAKVSAHLREMEDLQDLPLENEDGEESFGSTIFQDPLTRTLKNRKNKEKNEERRKRNAEKEKENAERRKKREQMQAMIDEENGELQKIKALNGRPDIDRLEKRISGVKISVFADSLHNFRIETKPELNKLQGHAFVYDIAYRTDYLRSDMREFKEDLIPSDMKIAEWRRRNEDAGFLPCVVPHEAEAIKRLANAKRHAWFARKSKANVIAGSAYMPQVVIDAINGKDVPVKTILSALTQELTGYKDAPIPLRDEFNSFTEAMTYWRSGVCRHRARTGFMILNAIGIPARLVVSRSHAFVEIYVPVEKGFWTQVDFGGGLGEDYMDMFPEITQFTFPNIPGIPIPGGLSSGGGGAAGAGGAAEATSGLLTIWPIIIGIFCILILVMLIIWIVGHYRQNSVDARIPVTSLTDFMLSQSEILNYDLERGEFRGAALTLLDAIVPTLPLDRQVQFKGIHDDLLKGKSFTKQEYNILAKQLLEARSAQEAPK
ncbi:MAG: hypothetical protein IJS08_09280, partial [Victivallales bacterium]|nr:hypothetical protein [Victivallales bacterium]